MKVVYAALSSKKSPPIGTPVRGQLSNRICEQTVDASTQIASGVGGTWKCILCYAKNCKDRGIEWPPNLGDPRAPEALEATPLVTPAHRNWTCQHHDEDRVRLAPAAICELTTTASTEGAKAVEREIYPAVGEIIPPPIVEATFVWVLHTAGGTYRGTIYTNGSRIDGDDPRIARNELAFIVLSDAGRTIAMAKEVSPD